MKMIPALLAAAALCSAPAFAQDHSDHKNHQPAGTSSMDMSKLTPEEMHKHCSTMMGAKMQGAPKHDHSADKLGHASAMKKPTEAEMKAMHEKCAAVMAQGKKP